MNEPTKAARQESGTAPLRERPGAPADAAPTAAYTVRQESRLHGHVVAPDGSGFCTAPIANCHVIARLLNEAAAKEATNG